MLGRLASGFLSVLPQIVPQSIRNYAVYVKFGDHLQYKGGSWGYLQTKVRDRFPRAKENHRIKVLGYFKRMSTPSGRRVIMRRIIKGKHCLSH